MESEKSIDELILKARKFILDRGYRAEYRYTCHWIWKKFRQYAKETQQSVYSTELGMEFYCFWLGYPTIAATASKDEFKFRVMMILDDIIYDRPLKRKYSHKPVHIPSCFQFEYDAYLKHITDKGQKKKSLETKMSRLLVFLRFLEKEGLALSALNFQAIEGFYRHISTVYNRTAQANIKFTIRDFIKFGGEVGFVPNDSEKFIRTIYGNKHERLQSTYTTDELNMILRAIDRNTAYGKRDYALIILLIQLGMRSSDVCNLSLSSINMEDHTITFIQQKTGAAEMLPLTEAAELALADYIINVNPLKNL